MIPSVAPKALIIKIPPPPSALAELLRLLWAPERDAPAVAGLISAEPALAAAVLQASHAVAVQPTRIFGAVSQAVATHGVDEIAALALESMLRATFAEAPVSERLFQRAAWRSRLMAGLAAATGLDVWSARLAGLFEECGKAVLQRHGGAAYSETLAAAPSDKHLCELETLNYHISHDALGASMCECWGLKAPVIVSVRHHVVAQATLELPANLKRRDILALSVLSHLLMTRPESWHELLPRLAVQAELDPVALLRAAQLQQVDRPY